MKPSTKEFIKEAVAFSIIGALLGYLVIYGWEREMNMHCENGDLQGEALCPAEAMEGQ